LLGVEGDFEDFAGVFGELEFQAFFGFFGGIGGEGKPCPP